MSSMARAGDRLAGTFLVIIGSLLVAIFGPLLWWLIPIFIIYVIFGKYKSGKKLESLRKGIIGTRAQVSYLINMGNLYDAVNTLISAINTPDFLTPQYQKIFYNEAANISEMMGNNDWASNYRALALQIVMDEEIKDYESTILYDVELDNKVINAINNNSLNNYKGPFQSPTWKSDKYAQYNYISKFDRYFVDLLNYIKSIKYNKNVLMVKYTDYTIESMFIRFQNYLKVLFGTYLALIIFVIDINYYGLIIIAFSILVSYSLSIKRTPNYIIEISADRIIVSNMGKIMLNYSNLIQNKVFFVISSKTDSLDIYQYGANAFTRKVMPINNFIFEGMEDLFLDGLIKFGHLYNSPSIS